MTENTNEAFPTTVELLLEWLDQNTPSIRPTPGFDKEKAIYQQGKRDLVDMLIEWRNDEYGKPIQVPEREGDPAAANPGAGRPAGRRGQRSRSRRSGKRT